MIPGVRGVYDRHAYLAEKRNALERLAWLVTQALDRGRLGVSSKPNAAKVAATPVRAPALVTPTPR